MNILLAFYMGPGQHSQESGNLMTCADQTIALYVRFDATIQPTWYSFVRKLTLDGQNIEALHCSKRSKDLINTRGGKNIFLSFPSSPGSQETAGMGVKTAG